MPPISPMLRHADAAAMSPAFHAGFHHESSRCPDARRQVFFSFIVAAAASREAPQRVAAKRAIHTITTRTPCRVLSPRL